MPDVAEVLVAAEDHLVHYLVSGNYSTALIISRHLQSQNAAVLVGLLVSDEDIQRFIWGFEV